MYKYKDKTLHRDTLLLFIILGILLIMAIRFQNQFVINTPANDLGSLQDPFSFSCWYQTNTSGSINSEDGISNSVFDVFFYGPTNTLQIDLKGQVPGSRVTPKPSIIVNQPYFVVGTWTSGSQTVYLNAQSIINGTISGPTISNTVALTLGPVTSGNNADSILSQPALYSGILSQQNVVDLYRGTITPQSLNAMWYAPLTGVLNTKVQAGDPGLNNIGFLGAGAANKYNISSIVGGVGSGWYVPDLFFIQPVNVTGYISKNGLFTIYASNAFTHLPAAVLSVGTGILVYANGVQQQMYGPVYLNVLQDTPIVSYKFINPINVSSVVTWNCPFGMINTAAGVNDEIINPIPANNYIGRLEPTFDGASSYVPQPSSLKLGVNIGHPPMINYYGHNLTMNATYRWGLDGNSQAKVVSDSNQQPYTATPGSQFDFFYFVGTTDGLNGAIPVPVGVHSVVFNDVNANAPNALIAKLSSTVTDTCVGVYGPAFFQAAGAGNGTLTLPGTASVAYNSPNVTLTTIPRNIQWMNLKFSGDNTNTTYRCLYGSGLNWVISPVFSGNNLSNAIVTTPGSTFLRTVSGTTVTVSYSVDYANFPNFVPDSYNFALHWNFTSPSGKWGANDPITGTPTISNFSCFVPGDSLTSIYPNYVGPHINNNGNNRSDPYAVSNVLKNWLVSSNGNGPACIRFMEPLMNYAAGSNYQTYSDIFPTKASWCWGGVTPSAIRVVGVRAYNTNPLQGPSPTGNGTYDNVSTKVYHPLLPPDGNTPGMGNFPNEYPQAGNYIDLTNRVNLSTGMSGILDFGNFLLNNSTGGGAMLEMITDVPHQLRSYDAVTSLSPQNAPLPYTLPITWNTTLPGVASGTNNSTTITLSLQPTNPSNQVGQTWTLAGDTSSGNYLVVSSNAAGTSWVVSPAFGGVTATGLIVTAHPTTSGLQGTAILTYGSPSVIFSQPQTITALQVAIFDSTGYGYQINPSVNNSTIGTIYPVYQSPTVSGATITLMPGCEWWNQTGVVLVTGPSSLVIVNENLRNGQFTYASTLLCPHQLPVSTSGIISNVTASGSHNSFFITTSAPLSNQIQRTWQFVGDTSNSAYTVNTCTLSALGTVGLNSPTVTLTAPVIGQVGQVWKFTGDSSAKSYTVISGSNTTYTISPVYGGTGGATSGVITTTGNDVNWTLSSGFAGNGSPTGMLINSSATFNLFSGPIGTTITYGFAANMCAQYPGCICWIPVGPHMSISGCKAIAAEMAPYLLPNSQVLVEVGLENWNYPTFPTGWASTWYGNLIGYYPSGVQVNPYYKSQGYAIDFYRAHVLMSVPIHDAFQQEFDTFGKGIKVIRLFGSFVDAVQKVSQATIQFACGQIDPGVSPQIPMGALAPAYYLASPTDSVWATAASNYLTGNATVTHGSPTVTTASNQSAGEIGQTWQFPGDTSYGFYTVQSGATNSWTISPPYSGSTLSLPIVSTSKTCFNCGEMLDFLRHYLKYSPSNKNLVTGHKSCIQTYYNGPTVDSQGRTYAGQVNGLPGLFAYEVEFQNPDPADKVYLQRDLLYHPEMYNLFNNMLQTWQEGGMNLANIYSLGGFCGGGAAQQLWAAILFHDQTYGLGLNNKFVTPQGGLPGDFHGHDAENQAVQLQSIRDWFSLANTYNTTINGVGLRFNKPPFLLHKGRRK